MMAKHKKMPMKDGKPAFLAKNASKKAAPKKAANGLTAAQKKLPLALQRAILKKKKSKK